MSIARQLEQSVVKLRVLMQRSNGEILEAGPAVLEEIDEAIGRVRGLEEVICINTDILKKFQEEGGAEYGESNAN